MKKLILSAIFAICTVATTMAQLEEGHVKFNLDVSASDPQMEMAVGMMQGSTVDVYFSGESIHSEVNMGAVMKVQTIVLGESGEALILMSGMMGNTAVPTSTEAMEKEAEANPAPEMEIELVDETKEILGYTCKKAIITDEDGNETIIPKKEFELLSFLMSSPNKVFRREEILRKVWGSLEIGNRTIDVHVRKLRERFGGSIIRTVKGVGYRYMG